MNDQFNNNNVSLNEKIITIYLGRIHLIIVVMSITALVAIAIIWLGFGLINPRLAIGVFAALFLTNTFVQWWVKRIEAKTGSRRSPD